MKCVPNGWSIWLFGFLCVGLFQEMDRNTGFSIVYHNFKGYISVNSFTTVDTSDGKFAVNILHETFFCWEEFTPHMMLSGKNKIEKSLVLNFIVV